MEIENQTARNIFELRIHEGASLSIKVFVQNLKESYAGLVSTMTCLVTLIPRAHGGGTEPPAETSDFVPLGLNGRSIFGTRDMPSSSSLFCKVASLECNEFSSMASSSLSNQFFAFFRGLMLT